MIKRFILLGLSLSLFSLMGCQIKDQTLINFDTITPRSVAYNYIFTHGMCMGYLGSLNSMSLVKFKDLLEKDQNAKYYVVIALAQPNKQNLKQAQFSIEQLLMTLE